MTSGNLSQVDTSRTIEAGDLPGDWSVKALGVVAQVYSGGTPSRANPDYWGPPIPWVTTTEVNFREIRSTKEQITRAGLLNSSAKMAPAGTLLVAMYGQGKTRGKTAILGIDAAMNQACAAIEPGKLLSPRFLFHYLVTSYDHIRALSNSGSQENLSGGIVKRILVPVPPLPEQIRIGQVLDDADNQIATIDRLIAKRQAIKQGMMHQLLTAKTRLPGFTKSWREVRLGDVAAMGSGGTPLSGVSHFYGGGVPWVSISDMTNAGKYVHTTEKTLTREGIANSAAKLYDEGVVLYAMYASLGECALPIGRMSSSQAILGILPGRQLDREFLYYLLCARKAKVKELGQHGTQSNLNAGMVRSFTLELPSKDEQQAIASVLRDTDKELDILHVRLAKAKAIKQGTMQELLTGRTRLPVAETVL